MKLYSRKLTSLDDLQAERRRLKGNPGPEEQAAPASDRAEATRAQEEPEVIEVSEVHEGSGNPLLDMLQQFMPGGASGATALSSGMMIFNLIPGSVKKKYLRMFLKEFVGGYIAWKALQLGYKGGKVLLHQYRERKKNEQLRLYP